MPENPLEPLVGAAMHEMRRRMEIVDRAAPEKMIPVGKRQLTAMELYMRDRFVPGFRANAVTGATSEDAAKYYRMLVRGRKSFEGKHGIFPTV